MMVTTETEMAQVLRALEAGAQEYVMKPFTKEVIEESCASSDSRGNRVARTRVLVVDDAVVVRRMLTDVLSAEADIEVSGVAANGKIALQKIAQGLPDVVTLDVEMPEMDGLATLREIRKTWPKLPVIMFSTLTERGAAATLDALALGASDYVTKPANVGSVTAAIAKIREELVPKVRALAGVPPPSGGGSGDQAGPVPARRVTARRTGSGRHRGQPGSPARHQRRLVRQTAEPLSTMTWASAALASGGARSGQAFASTPRGRAHRRGTAVDRRDRSLDRRPERARRAAAGAAGRSARAGRHRAAHAADVHAAAGGAAAHAVEVDGRRRPGRHGVAGGHGLHRAGRLSHGIAGERRVGAAASRPDTAGRIRAGRRSTCCSDRWHAPTARACSASSSPGWGRTACAAAKRFTRRAAVWSCRTRRPASSGACRDSSLARDSRRRSCRSTPSRRRSCGAPARRWCQALLPAHAFIREQAFDGQLST